MLMLLLINSQHLKVDSNFCKLWARVQTKAKFQIYNSDY